MQQRDPDEAAPQDAAPEAGDPAMDGEADEAGDHERRNRHDGEREADAPQPGIVEQVAGEARALRLALIDEQPAHVRVPEAAQDATGAVAVRRAGCAGRPPRR